MKNHVASWSIALFAGFAVVASYSSQLYAAGFGTYYANVGVNGTLGSNSDVAGVVHTGLGTYTVTFNNDISACGVVSSVRGTTAGFAISTNKGSSAVLVTTKLGSWSATDTSVFHFVVP